jgi:uncharacterized protein YbjT (DUF2867 family)
MRSHREVAAHLDALGLAVTYLAPSMYMETLIGAAHSIREDGAIFAPAGRGRVAFIAVSDVAAVAAKVLTSHGHENETYVLTGPEALGYAEVAARVSAVFAREVDYVSQPPARARQAMLAHGKDRWLADGILEQFEWIRHGGADTVTSAVRAVTGADPRPLQDWLGGQREAFLAPDPGP